jgi:hypothetical protein
MYGAGTMKAARFDAWRLLAVLWPVTSTAGFYLGFSLSTYSVYGEGSGLLSPLHAVDFLLFAVLSSCLYAVSKKKSVFVIVQGAFIATIFVAHRMKMGVFGTPIVPDDFASLMELLQAIDGWYLASAIGACFLGLALVGWCTSNLRRPAGPKGIAAVGIPAALVGVLYLAPQRIADPVITRDWYRSYRPVDNFMALGPALYFVVETARYLGDSDRLHPSRDEVQRALDNRLDASPSVNARRREGWRNVYVLVLESFWDASRLRTVRLSEDPFYPPFRRLWEQGGPSWAISPVFGGYSTNAEFEILCGQPAGLHGGGVVFQRYLRNDAPCLPRILADSGYEATAFCPAPPQYFDAARAYRRIGFKSAYFIRDLDDTDKDGRYLSNESLLGQVVRHVAEQPGGRRESPRLVYMFGVAGHWPFDLNLRRRPKRIEGTGPAAVERLANSTWYASKAVSEFLSAIQIDDPDALVVVVGDHLPILAMEGTATGPYIAAGLFGPDRVTPEKYKTPLLVVDGPRGAVSVGTIAMYRLPRLILKLLGHQGITALDLFTNDFPYEVGPEGLTQIWPDGKVTRCLQPNESPDCRATLAWMEGSRILSADLIAGSQFVYGFVPALERR